MQTVSVNLGPRSYSIQIIAHETLGWLTFLKSALGHTRKLFFVSDTHTTTLMQKLRDLSLGAYECNHAIIPAGESSKSMAQFSFLLDELAEFGADRQTGVVAVGGGVIGDLAGFAAAAYNRGLPFIQVPTTLLAMVDSSVGGKVGINHPKGKNLIGAFHQPKAVWIDIGSLVTLPEREYLSGLAEVVKYGVIQDPQFFEFLEQNTAKILKRDAAILRQIVARCCRLKADVVEKDEREETGLRMILNYGHTFAHAFETVSGYGHWLHGEAVAAGMVYASRLAEKKDLIPASITERQIKLLSEFRLPVKAESGWKIPDLIEVMKRDKKAQAGRLRFILPVKLGEVRALDDVTEQQVAEVLAP
ncbi:3-dehydroquinate synthase [Telmatocola sphagniphila]|jgi:3-dehydroquinate synthase|uniref:3-dehydroquinate synthase n=1 Tax=Telmatocola sphagniphila TaxID=1123043 RepID=A0A8E6B790_9BACT|nr:3-dehydroquinate synthase [Telmatocola sphagniphila]QVL32574.1 3-dehydroquinate synthase [Telmatocola sphagniphila]